MRLRSLGSGPWIKEGGVADPMVVGSRSFISSVLIILILSLSENVSRKQGSKNTYSSITAQEEITFQSEEVIWCPQPKDLRPSPPREAWVFIF